MVAVILLVIGIFVCIFCSAFFSASEMSFSSTNELRLEHMLENGNKKANKALEIVKNFDKALSAILIGNNLVNIAASSMGSVVLILLLRTDAFSWISTIVITCLVIIFGETIPKIAAKKNATRWSIAFSGIVKVLMTILYPLVFVVVGLTNLISKNLKGEVLDIDEDEKIDELSSIIETAEDEEVLEEDQSELVQAAIDFLDMSAYEAMTSRVDVVAIDIEDSWEDILQTIEESQFSRIPVYEESIDNVIGILYLNHFLKAMTENEIVDIRSLVMKPIYVYKTTKLTSVLEQLRSAKQHMAIVCNEYGGTHGIITMEDIMEEIVGDIWDESDVVEEEVKEISDTKFEIDGDLGIDDFIELLNIKEDVFEYDSDTVGGWVLEHFEVYPKIGDGFTDEELGLKVKILNIQDRRVDKLLIEKI